MDPLVLHFEDGHPMVKLVPEETPARKRFSARLRYGDLDRPSPIDFDVTASGFGLFGREDLLGIGEYAEQSVMVLQHHFLTERHDDHPYTIRLWWTCHALGAAALAHGVRPRETAVEAVAMGWGAPDRVGRIRSTRRAQAWPPGRCVSTRQFVRRPIARAAGR
jgi:hypothetical protein